MKKSFLLLTIASIGFVSAGKAQSPGFALGVKAGANMNKIEGQSFRDGFTFGYQLGGFAELNFSRPIGIQTEVLWTETQARPSDRFGDIYQEVGSNVKDLKLNYINIPVLLNIRPSNFITFQVGPQYGILVNKDQRWLDNGKDAFTDGDFSMVAGAQLKILKFRVYGRYVAGMNSINDIDNQDDWKRRAWQVGLGFAF